MPLLLVNTPPKHRFKQPVQGHKRCDSSAEGGGGSNDPWINCSSSSPQSIGHHKYHTLSSLDRATRKRHKTCSTVKRTTGAAERCQCFAVVSVSIKAPHKPQARNSKGSREREHGRHVPKGLTCRTPYHGTPDLPCAAFDGVHVEDLQLPWKSCEPHADLMRSLCHRDGSNATL